MSLITESSKVIDVVKTSGVDWNPAVETCKHMSPVGKCHPQKQAHLQGLYKDALVVCDDACVTRYLKTHNGDVGKAAKALEATVRWRKAQGADELDASEFDIDVKEGFVYIAGHDPEGRPVVVLRKRDRRLVGPEVDHYLRYLTYVMEGCVRNMRDGATQLIWVMDLDNYSAANAPAPSTTQASIKLVQDHYPERLYMCYVVNAPTVFEMSFMLLNPFMSSGTKKRVEFVRTADAAAKAASSSKTWGSFAKSWMSSSSSSKNSSSSANSSSNPTTAGAAAVNAEGACGGDPATATAGGAGAGGATAGASKGAAAAKAMSEFYTCNSSSFEPLLGCYWTPYAEATYRGLLAVGQ